MIGNRKENDFKLKNTLLSSRRSSIEGDPVKHYTKAAGGVVEDSMETDSDM